MTQARSYRHKRNSNLLKGILFWWKFI